MSKNDSADLADALLELINSHDNLNVFERSYLFQAGYVDEIGSTISLEIFPAFPAIDEEDEETEEFTLTIRKTRRKKVDAWPQPKLF